MKKIILTIIVASVAICTKAQQVDQFNEIKQQLDSDSQESIDAALEYSKKGDDKANQAKTYYAKADNMKKQAASEKKGKAKKTLKEAEAQITMANSLDVSAYNFYYKANKIYYSVYTENLDVLAQSAKPERREAAEITINEAKNNYEQSEKLLKTVPTGKDADAKKVYQIKKDANAKQNEAISQLIQAYGNYLWFKEPEPEVVAQEVQEPILPKIEAPKVEANEDKIIYKVQIAADNVPLSIKQLRKIYPSNDIINNELHNGLYKYSVGFYTSYEQAEKAKELMGVAGAFIVAYKNGQRVEDIIEVHKK